MGFLATALIMFYFWVLLSGYFDFFHLFTGALSSLFVAHISHDMLFDKRTGMGLKLRRAWGLLRYLPWLLFEIFKANLDVAYRTIHPRMPIDPRLISFRTSLKEDLGITTLANSITLTPGTVTIEAAPEEFVVHAISESAAGGLLSGEMVRRVERIEHCDV